MTNDETSGKLERQIDGEVERRRGNANAKAGGHSPAISEDVVDAEKEKALVELPNRP